MTLNDKTQHAIGGAVVGVLTLLLLWVAQRLGPAFAVLAAGVLVGAGFEALQRLRNEGAVELLDAVATAAGAGAVAAALQWLWPLVERQI